MATPGPLTPDDLAELKKRLEELDEAERLIEQSVRAGIDMSNQQKQARELRDRLTRMKQAFFPGQ